MKTAHYASLQSKHAELQARLDAESQRPHPDDATVRALKVKKLRLKDTLTHH